MILVADTRCTQRSTFTMLLCTAQIPICYKNKFLASTMMLHDRDELSVETCSCVVENKNSLFQEIEWRRTLASPWNSLCKIFILYT